MMSAQQQLEFAPPPLASACTRLGSGYHAGLHGLPTRHRESNYDRAPLRVTQPLGSVNLLCLRHRRIFGNRVTVLSALC